MDIFYNKITAYPIAFISGVGGAINFEDLRPILVVVFGFIIDIIIKFLKNKFNDKN